MDHTDGKCKQLKMLIMVFIIFIIISSSFFINNFILLFTGSTTGSDLTTYGVFIQAMSFVGLYLCGSELIIYDII